MCVEGMGKTTLAHVVATHCGYRPFEINASDDRSAPALKDKMVSTLHSILKDLMASVCGGWAAMQVDGRLL